MDTAEIQKKKKIRILWTTICQQIRQSGRNGKLSRILQPAKTESKEKINCTDQSLEM